MTDDCYAQDKEPGEVSGKGRGRKVAREALQWRDAGGHAMVTCKLLDQFQHVSIASRSAQNSRAQLSYAK
jgi:hypothetical protein